VKSLILALPFAALLLAGAAPAHAEKFGFCEDEVKSASDCFVVMVQETYRKCRIVQSMMTIEYGFADSYLPDNNGEKLNSCIEKHRKGIQTAYKAAQKEVATHKTAREKLTELHKLWLDHMQALIPALVESLDGYEARVREATDSLRDRMASAQTAFHDALASAKHKKPAALTAKLAKTQ
jgi:hypothetical protein